MASTAKMNLQRARARLEARFFRHGIRPNMRTVYAILRHEFPDMTKKQIECLAGDLLPSFEHISDRLPEIPQWMQKCNYKFDRAAWIRKHMHGPHLPKDR